MSGDKCSNSNQMASCSVKRVTLSGYVFNPDEDKPRFVFAFAVTF